MVLATMQHHSHGVLRNQRTATRTGEWGREMDLTATIRDPRPQPELISLFEEAPGGGRPGSVTDFAPQVRVQRHRGAQGRGVPIRADPRAADGEPADGSVPAPQYADSPSWLSKCPRSRLHPVVLAGALFLWCRRRNSWWKCLQSYPFLLCTGLWSRTWTFQFLMVVAVGAARTEFNCFNLSLTWCCG